MKWLKRPCSLDVCKIRTEYQQNQDRSKYNDATALELPSDKTNTNNSPGSIDSALPYVNSTIDSSVPRPDVVRDDIAVLIISEINYIFSSQDAQDVRIYTGPDTDQTPRSQSSARGETAMTVSEVEESIRGFLQSISSESAEQAKRDEGEQEASTGEKLTDMHSDEIKFAAGNKADKMKIQACKEEFDSGLKRRFTAIPHDHSSQSDNNDTTEGDEAVSSNERTFTLEEIATFTDIMLGAAPRISLDAARSEYLFTHRRLHAFWKSYSGYEACRHG